MAQDRSRRGRGSRGRDQYGWGAPIRRMYDYSLDYGSLGGPETDSETIPGYEFYSWYGLWGPARLPQDIAQRLKPVENREWPPPKELAVAVRQRPRWIVGVALASFHVFDLSTLLRTQ